MTTDAQNIDLSPAFVNFTNLVQGDTFSFTITLTDGDNDDAPINLTGTSADMTIRRLDNTIVLALSNGDGIDYTDAVNGVMTCTVAAADTTALNPDFSYLYDVQWTNGAIERTIASGRIQLIKQQTTV